ncbi:MULTISPECIES: glycerol-3-phosphate 1-O-acyltransferase PlsY [Helicobacter]|uniref:Glycerol-3-phosphate acyltransferase n=1 Tax=Helicobacter macacae MIT 99-5501 TaxID=1357400 RepID=V8C5A1_9HELI|nr:MULTISPECIES: glycerol-3-phosphate 1-O-acyltransferase PlsY [Helicobacter]ETD22205.1 acyl-phosphate glycerol 3-phosphate acyltransferase [Helicobacter macacae MIT 99-5501]RDU54742.1 glycerol-3-phosphate 1-O-acyltransferase PlsY [Helicobacter sp. MIT 01-3238]
MEFFTNYINLWFYLLAFFVGGIPFGVMLTKVLYGIDLRKIGSGSIGATNVYRALKEHDPKRAKLISIATLILDAIKGTVIIALAKAVGLPYGAQWFMAILAVLGHCYSPYLGFHGGKGVSTAIGSVILLMPIEGALGLVVWAVVGKVFKVSSLSSLTGVLSGVVLTFVIPYLLPLPPSIDITAQINSHTPIVLIGLIILYTHIPNIMRLFKGQESKVL